LKSRFDHLDIKEDDIEEDDIEEDDIKYNDIILPLHPRRAARAHSVTFAFIRMGQLARDFFEEWKTQKKHVSG